MTVGKRLFPVRWYRCMRGAIMPAGPFFAYFLWANKESKRGMIAFKNSESNSQLTLTFLRIRQLPFLCYPSS
jgi:hypothetical protein